MSTETHTHTHAGENGAGERVMAPEKKMFSTKQTAYKRWLAEEGVSVVEDYAVTDVKTVPLSYWKRMGAPVAFLNLYGEEELSDSYICEIPPGDSTLRQQHLYEEVVYVLFGTGSTTVKNASDHGEQQFEWGPGSVFALPPNVIYRHFNTSATAPARFISVTTAPPVMNFFHNEEFVFENPFVFRDRFAGEEGHFNGDGQLREGRPAMWETNFVPDVHNFKLVDYPERGAGGTNIKFEIGGGTIAAHISEFPTGTYKKGHRHDPGAHVIVLDGAGYTLMWPSGPDPEIRQFDWAPGTLIVPPGMFYHQHFNVGGAPARYLAIRACSSSRFPVRQKFYGRMAWDDDRSGDQIEYDYENPEIARRFAEALEKNGVENKMPH